MATEYKPLSTIVSEFWEILTANTSGVCVLFPITAFPKLITRIVELETALAISNNTVAILKGEKAFQSEEELVAHIESTINDDVLFFDGQPAVKTIDTIHGGT